MTTSSPNTPPDRSAAELPEQHPSAALGAAVPGSCIVVFLGDSITAGGRWDLLFPGIPSANFGVNGDHTHQVLSRLAPIIRLKPAKLFLLIGTNDLGGGIVEDTTVANVAKILDQLQSALPRCRIHLQTVLPREAEYTARVQSLNQRYAQLAQAKRVVLIDLFPLFDDGHGKLRPDLTDDGLHLLGAGYDVWRAAIAPYVL